MTARPLRRASAGFTLIEVLVVVSVLGLVMAALAATFVVVARTSPANEARADDSRALLSLTEWLSEDVSSTAETGFSVGNSGTGCDPSTVPTTSSIGLLELQWPRVPEYVVNYRYVPTSTSNGVIVRYACKVNGPAEALTLTPDLQDELSGALAPAPVEINLLTTTMADGTPGHRGLEFIVTVLDDSGSQRELLRLDATTTNVLTTLPPLTGGPGGGNTAPVAANGTTSVTVGSTVVYGLPVTDSEGDAMTTAISDIPTGWNITSTGVHVTITPDPAATPGTYSFSYTATDARGEESDRAWITVIASADTGNLPPVANAVITTATRGVPFTVDLTTQVSDPELGPVTVVFSSVPTGWIVVESSPLIFEVTPPTTAAPTTSLTYVATDDSSNSTISTVTVNVCTVTITGVSPGSVQVHNNGSNAGKLNQNVLVTIASNGACSPLVLGFRPKATDTIDQTKNFGTGTSVTIGKDEFTWDIPSPGSPRNVQLTVRQGALGSLEAQRNLETK